MATTAVAARHAYRAVRVRPRALRNPRVVASSRRSVSSVASAGARPVDVAVLGGGAAGLTAAYFAAREGDGV